MARSQNEVKDIVRRALEILGQYVHVRHAFLFGSYASGNPNENSDIDLAVFADGIDEMSLEEKVTIIANVQKETEAEIELHLFPTSAFSEARPTNFLGHIVKTGLSLPVWASSQVVFLEITPAFS